MKSTTNLVNFGANKGHLIHDLSQDQSAVPKQLLPGLVLILLDFLALKNIESLGGVRSSRLHYSQMLDKNF